MDVQRFDRLTRAFATRQPRRRLLRLLGGGMLGALAGPAWTRTVVGKPDDHIKVGLCHRTGAAEPAFVFIEVNEQTVAAHLGHGDFPSKGPPCPTRCECTTDADCPEGTMCGGCFCVQRAG